MPLSRWIHYRQVHAQKKKALHMLTLSGVVRPSTSELRYTTPLSHIVAEPSCDEQAPITQDASTSASSALPGRSAEPTHLAQHLRSAAFRLFAKSKRHIQRLQWDTSSAA